MATPVTKFFQINISVMNNIYGTGTFYSEDDNQINWEEDWYYWDGYNVNESSRFTLSSAGYFTDFQYYNYVYEPAGWNKSTTNGSVAKLISKPNNLDFSGSGPYTVAISPTGANAWAFFTNLYLQNPSAVSYQSGNFATGSTSYSFTLSAFTSSGGANPVKIPWSWGATNTSYLLDTELNPDEFHTVTNTVSLGTSATPPLGFRSPPDGQGNYQTKTTSGQFANPVEFYFEYA